MEQADGGLVLIGSRGGLGSKMRRVAGYGIIVVAMIVAIAMIAAMVVVVGGGLEAVEEEAEAGGLGLEAGVLLEDLVVGVGGEVELVDEPLVLSTEANHLGPQLVQVLLLPHPRPPRRLAVGYHPPLPPLVDRRQHDLLVLRLLRRARRVAARRRGGAELDVAVVGSSGGCINVHVIVIVGVGVVVVLERLDVVEDVIMVVVVEDAWREFGRETVES